MPVTMIASARHFPSLRERQQRVQRLVLTTSFRAALLVAVVVVGILYLVETTTVAARGYTMTELERQVAALQTENRRLEVALAEASSIQNITERLKNSNLVAVDAFEHASSLENTVARR